MTEAILRRPENGLKLAAILAASGLVKGNAMSETEFEMLETEFEAFVTEEFNAADFCSCGDEETVLARMLKSNPASFTVLGLLSRPEGPPPARVLLRDRDKQGRGVGRTSIILRYAENTDDARCYRARRHQDGR